MSSGYAISIFAIIFNLISILCSWAAVACQIIGTCFVFKKMGLPAWKGIIPFYNYYILFDKVWEKKKFKTYVILTASMIAVSILMTIFMVISMVVGAYNLNSGYRNAVFAALTVMIIIAIVSLLAIIAIGVVLMVLEYKLYKRLAASFGKSTGFAVGLLFLYPVFIMILGFDKSAYIPAAYQNPNPNNYRPPYQNNYQ